MSERDRGMAIAMLAEAYGIKLEDLTPARIRIYNQALAKVPTPLLEPMVQKAIASRTWFPKVAELLADAESCRQEMVRSLGDYGCDQCYHSGWVIIGRPNGNLARRCQCWEQHQQKLANLGVGHVPLALPAGIDWQEN